MWDLMLWFFWAVFGAYTFWFFSAAKKLQPLSIDELVILWKLHKLHTGCSAPISEVEPVQDTHSHEFVGFTCQCDYQYVSKRLITQRNAREPNMFYYTTHKKKETSKAQAIQLLENS